MQRGVDVYTIVQHPGQYVIVKPGVLHWGYNAGANTAEAVNFALANHDKEVCDSDGYKFLVCRSGIRFKVDTPDGYCVSGHENEVCEIHAKDLSFIYDLFAVGRHKTASAKKRQGTHFASPKRKHVPKKV